MHTTKPKQKTSTMRFKFHTSAESKDQTNKKVYGPSLTVPDQTLSVAELISRHQRGLPLTGRQPVYSIHESATDEELFNFPVNSTMDLADREALSDQLQAQIGRLKQQATQEAKEEKERLKKAKNDAELKQYEKLKQLFEKKPTERAAEADE